MLKNSNAVMLWLYSQFTAPDATRQFSSVGSSSVNSGNQELCKDHINRCIYRANAFALIIVNLIYWEAVDQCSRIRILRFSDFKNVTFYAFFEKTYQKIVKSRSSPQSFEMSSHTSETVAT